MKGVTHGAIVSIGSLGRTAIGSLGRAGVMNGRSIGIGVLEGVTMGAVGVVSATGGVKGVSSRARCVASAVQILDSVTTGVMVDHR